MITPAEQHSPGELHRNIRPISHYPILFAGRNTHVARVITDGFKSADVAEANADRIVLCWNAHDDLQSAVEQASLGSSLDPLNHDDDSLRTIAARVDSEWARRVLLAHADRMDAALAKAGAA